MNEPTYEKFKDALFISLCKNLQINENDLIFLPKADPEIVNKYKFYYEYEKAKMDFVKEKMRPVLTKIFGIIPLHAKEIIKKLENSLD